MKARTNEKIKIPYGGEYLPDDNATGVPDFEQALGSFLADESRDKDALAAYIPKILGIYKNAEKVTDERYETATKDLVQLEKEIKELEYDIKKVTQTLNDIVDTTNNTVKSIILAAKTAYDDYTETIEKDWDSYFEENSVPSLSILGIMWDKIRGNDCEQRFKPILDAISTYIDTKYVGFEQSLTDIFDKKITEYEKKMANYELMLSSAQNINLGEMLGRLVASKGLDKVAHGETSFIKVVLAAVLGDPEHVVDGALDKDSMSAFIMKLVKTNILDSLKVMILDWLLGPYGLILFVIEKIIKTIANRANSTTEILENTKPMLLEELNSAKQAFANNLELQLSEILIKNINIVCSDMKTNLAEKQDENEKILQLRKENALNVDAMKKQMDANLSKMKEIISDIAESVNFGEVVFE